MYVDDLDVVDGQQLHPLHSRLRFGLRPLLAVGLVVVLVGFAVLGLWRLTRSTDNELVVVETNTGAQVGDGDAVGVGGVQSQQRPPGYGLSGDLQQGHQSALIVHVVGAVQAPGVVQLPAGSRVIDAVESVGGVVEGADLSGLNLAAHLSDGAQVYVPLEGESPTQLPAAASGPSPTSPGTSCVDLNNASEEELQTLDGVGPKLAARIAQWRTTAAPITTAQDLVAVPGIGAILASRISADSCQ